MACNCVDAINGTLAPGHMLYTTLGLGANPIVRPLIPLMRTDTWKLETRSGKRGSMLCMFCPFCGVHYRDDVSAPAATP